VATKIKRLKPANLKSKPSKLKIVSKRRDYSYGPNWRGFSFDVKVERGRVCQSCGTSKNLQDHHLIPLTRGGANNRGNLKVLCKKCHDKKH
jgi:5-methylcytosine-specific restriction endonuclease McrA